MLWFPLIVLRFVSHEVKSNPSLNMLKRERLNWKEKNKAKWLSRYLELSYGIAVFWPKNYKGLWNEVKAELISFSFWFGLCGALADFRFCLWMYFQFVDDDKKSYLDINYTFDIRKDWL
jgi:hypothetical protein